MEKTPKRQELCITFRKDQLQIKEDFIAIAQNFSSYAQLLEYLNSLAKSPQFVEYQKCEFFSENPDAPDYIVCLREAVERKSLKFRVNKKREDCFLACRSSSIVKVELNQEAKKTRLDLEVSTLEKKKKSLEDKITKLEPQVREFTTKFSDLKTCIGVLEKIARDKDLEKVIENLKEKHNVEMENLKKKHEAEIKDKNGIIETLAKKIKDFKEQQTQLSKIEPQTKAESPATITQAQPPAMETTVEVKVFQKPVVVPDVSEEKKILCPKTNQEVSMKEQCKMPNCKDFLECKLYVQTIKERDG
jgi:hypothetical protein